MTIFCEHCGQAASVETLRSYFGDIFPGGDFVWLCGCASEPGMYWTAHGVRARVMKLLRCIAGEEVPLQDAVKIAASVFSCSDVQRNVTVDTASVMVWLILRHGHQLKCGCARLRYGQVFQATAKCPACGCEFQTNYQLEKANKVFQDTENGVRDE